MGILVVGIIAVVIAGIVAYVIMQKSEKKSSERQAVSQTEQKKEMNRGNSFFVDIPKTLGISPENLTVSSLFEEQPVSKDGFFSLAKSKLDSIYQTIFIKDKSGHQILMAVAFPRSSAPKTLTTKQKELIEPYLYPNRRAIVADTKSTTLALLITSAEIMTTTDTGGLLLETIKFLERDDFDKLAESVNRMFTENPRGYLISENKLLYSNILKFAEKASSAVKQPEAVGENESYYDCGASDSCFSEYVKLCSPAKAMILENGLSFEEKVRKDKDGQCDVYLKYISAPAGFTGVIGKEMSCKVPESRLADFRDYLNEGQMKKSCKGSLVDFISSKKGK